MSRSYFFVCLLAIAGSGSFFSAGRNLAKPRNLPAGNRQGRVANRRPAALSIPLTFEPHVGQAGRGVQFVGRGKGMTVLLTRREIAVQSVGMQGEFRLRFLGAAALKWRADEKLRAESNYFVGRNRKAWRTHIPHFARVEAAQAAPGIGVSVYGNDEGVEYDLRAAPGADVSKFRLNVSGADDVRLTHDGDLLLNAGGRELRMKKPAIYEELPDGKGCTVRKALQGEYTLEADRTVGFRTGPRDAGASLVIDPSLSVSYATFLGGAGADAASSVAVDSTGKVYMGGTAASPSTFSEPNKSLGPGGGATAFFVAKIDPTATGAASLLYLTFLGGSGTQSGGQIALDSANNVAILGTTTSPDYPVTDSTSLTSGANDLAVSEIDPTGSKLVFSALLGGNGAESQNGTGGIAVDSTGRVYIASDTSSSNLPATSGAFQMAWDGLTSDALFAVYTPPASVGGAATLNYCSYLGTNSNGPVAVGGLAVDARGNAYIAGSTANSVNGFPTKNAMQTAYGGGDSDAFLMKISPGGQGWIDVVYSTLLGGSAADAALGVAVDGANPANAYVTGTTHSADFPMTGTVSGFQTSLHSSATANAFLAVVAQNPQTAMTSLSYATYLGGSASDAGQGIAVSAANAVYVTGSTASWDFPWHDNLQPFNGAEVAFVAKLDTTKAGSASLLYATPLGGTLPPGGTASAAGNGIATDGKGNVFVAGVTTASDFPTAVTTGGSLNGVQPACANCGHAPPISDAFLVGITESASAAPSVYFNVPRVNFPATLVGTQNPPQLVAVLNGGDPGATLTITDIEITPNNGDFSLMGQTACFGKAINPGPSPQCSFEISFTPSVPGLETAFISFTDNAPGSPQLLEVTGAGAGLAPTPGSLNFPSQPEGTTSNPQSVTLSNSSGQQLLIDSVTLASNAAAAGFQFGATANTCAPSANGLAAGASCVIAVTFTPQSIGAVQSEADLTYHVPGTAESLLAIPLTGTSTAAGPVAAILPASLDLEFGSIAVGATSGAQMVKLANQGSAPLNLAGIAITGANAGDFAITSTGTSCPLSGGSLGIGQNCTVAISFAPQSSGARSAQLGFTDNAPGSPQQVALNGSATAPASLQVSPSTLPSFGSQSEGTASAPQSVTITNTGSAAADLTGVALTGANAGDFSLATTCPPSLGPGKNCQASVTFAPAAAMPPGARSAALNIPGGNPSSIALSGAATQSGASLPASLNFGSQLVGTAGPAQPVNLTNTGTGALVVNTATVQGTNSADFLIGSDACAAGSTAPSSSCSIQVTFKPVEASPCGANPNRGATLVLNDNAPGSPHSVPLSGTAADFCFVSQSGNNITTPIAPGQTASFPLEIDSSGGYSGSVGLACTGAPPLGSCSIVTTPATSPASVTVAPNTPGDFTANISTAAQIPGGFFREPLWYLPAATLLAIALLILMASGSRKDLQWRERALRFGQSLVLLGLLGAGIASCGGGGGADPPPAGTPAGTYTVTVTATPAGGGTTRTIPLTFSVN